MHLLATLAVIIIAWSIRCQPVSSSATWYERWYEALFRLLFPSLLILSTSVAVLYMGCHGAMLGIKAGSWGCGIAGSLIMLAFCCLIKLVYQSYRSIAKLAICPKQSIDNKTVRLIDIEIPYSAQIGFWHPQLVLSSGLIKSLDKEHLKAVLAHEQAHLHYRDTFWFFWLGWMRSFSCWLPNSEALWQELLLLRELRADNKAAQEVDFLLLAESLLTVAQVPFQPNVALSANFNDRNLGDRLNERIDFLLEEKTFNSTNHWQNISWICLLCLPLLTIPFHY